MYQTLLFMIKTVIIISFLMWAISLGGYVDIGFAGFNISTTFGIFITLLLITLWVISILWRFIHGLLSVPRTITTFNAKRAQKIGMQSLALGLSAVAANDIRLAQYYTKRTSRYLKHDFGLSHLLSTLTARLEGDSRTALKSAHGLLKYDETSFMGYKSLINTAIDNHDLRYARVLLDQADIKHPHNPWFLQCHYDVETRTGHFENALHILKALRKRDIISKRDFNDKYAMLIFAMGDWDKAYKQNSNSLALGLSVLKKITVERKNRKAQKIIRHLWAINPHADLMNHWITSAPKSAHKTPDKMIAWVEDLFAINPDDASSNLYTGQALIKIGHQKSAKLYLETALRLKPTLATYQAMNTIDPIGQWLQGMTNAADDKIWVCHKTGKKYSDWSLLTNEKHFNSLEWIYPSDIAPREISNQLL